MKIYYEILRLFNILEAEGFLLPFYSPGEIKNLIEHPYYHPGIFKGRTRKALYDIVKDEIEEFWSSHDVSAFLKNLLYKSPSKFHIFSFIFLKEIGSPIPSVGWQAERKKEYSIYEKDAYNMLKPHFYQNYKPEKGLNSIINYPSFIIKMPPILIDEIEKKGYLRGIKIPMRAEDFEEFISKIFQDNDQALFLSSAIHATFYIQQVVDNVIMKD